MWFVKFWRSLCTRINVWRLWMHLRSKWCHHPALNFPPLAISLEASTTTDGADPTRYALDLRQAHDNLSLTYAICVAICTAIKGLALTHARTHALLKSTLKRTCSS